MLVKMIVHINATYFIYYYGILQTLYSLPKHLKLSSFCIKLLGSCLEHTTFCYVLEIVYAKMRYKLCFYFGILGKSLLFP